MGSRYGDENLTVLALVIKVFSMTVSKCEQCFRHDVCSLRPLAELTVPWVIEEQNKPASSWEKQHNIKRVLRGSGYSPGFIEDWELAGAMSSEETKELVELVVKSKRVTLALLTLFCRQYQGPELVLTFEGDGCAA